MICERCGCEDYFIRIDRETGEKVFECQNCGAEIESNIEEYDEDYL